MEFLALVILVVVAVAVAVGVHTGPHGMVAAGGLGVAASVAFVVGVIALAPSDSRTVIGLGLLAAAGAVSAAALVAGLIALPALRRHEPAVAPSRLWGADGVALTDLNPLGTARVRGESWTAESLSGPLPAGTTVHVVEVEGLRLRVISDDAQMEHAAPSAPIETPIERSPHAPEGVGEVEQSNRSEENLTSPEEGKSPEEDRTWPQ
jgi:membrane-bound ClpP family serine protease